MSIQKYRAFIKVADLGSFTKAAKDLQYTQSSISQMIGHLEDSWGLSLLTRHKSGIKLTSEGKALLPYVRKLCESYRELESEVAGIHGVQAGFIKIATFPSIAGTWLPGVIRAFVAEYPLVDFEIVMGDYMEITRMLQEGIIDCAVMSAPHIEDTPFDFTFIENDDYVVLLSEDSPLKEYDRIPLSVFAEYPMILLEKDGLTEELSHFFRLHDITPNVRFRTWDNNAVMCMVENSLGISILSRLMIQRSSYRIIVKELEVQASRRVGYCVKNRQSSPALVKRFLEFIQLRDLSSE